MKNCPTLNTYIGIYLFAYADDPCRNSARIYISNKAAKLDLHLDVPYGQAKLEMARLMLRTGRLPEIIGKDDGTGVIMYTLTAFLD